MVRKKMNDLVRDMLAVAQTEIALSPEQLTELMMELADRFDRLEELALADPDGAPVDLVSDLTQSLVKRPGRAYLPPEEVAQREADNALARHEVAEHAKDLQAQQHVWKCPECGHTNIGELLSCCADGCGFRKGSPSEVPS